MPDHMINMPTSAAITASILNPNLKIIAAAVAARMARVVIQSFMLSCAVAFKEEEFIFAASERLKQNI